MNKALARAIVLIFIFCTVFSSSTLAATENNTNYSIDDLALSVAMPEDWIVFTRNTSPDDPRLSELGFDYLRDHMVVYAKDMMLHLWL